MTSVTIRHRHDWRVPCCWGCLMHGHRDGCYCPRTFREAVRQRRREQGFRLVESQEKKETV